MLTSLLEGLENSETPSHAPARERMLLAALIELAIEDLKSEDGRTRKLAKWWIFQDRSITIDAQTGYISFGAACEFLDLSPERLKTGLLKKFNKERKKNGKRRQAEQ